MYIVLQINHHQLIFVTSTLHELKQSRSDQRKSELLLLVGEHPFGEWEQRPQYVKIQSS